MTDAHVSTVRGTVVVISQAISLRLYDRSVSIWLLQCFYVQPYSKPTTGQINRSLKVDCRQRAYPRSPPPNTQRSRCCSAIDVVHNVSHFATLNNTHNVITVVYAPRLLLVLVTTATNTTVLCWGRFGAR